MSETAAAAALVTFIACRAHVSEKETATGTIASVEHEPITEHYVLCKCTLAPAHSFTFSLLYSLY